MATNISFPANFISNCVFECKENIIDDSAIPAKFDIFHAKLLKKFLTGNFIVFEGIFEFLGVIEGMSLIYSLIQNDKFIAISAASCVENN